MRKSSMMSSPKDGGLVINYEKTKNKEKINYIADDSHSLILGATRSGKTRSLILQTICLTGLAGESMFISDVKGELYDYTSNFLERVGYEVVVIDFKTPLKSMKYNFLQPIIDEFKRNNFAEAVSLTWDLTEIFVPESKGEKIWHDGEASIIAGAVISVIWDNMHNPEFQNLTNVYAFINNMCMPDDKGRLPINKYIQSLDDSHPAKQLFGVALIAPERTRGSFFTSALATLRLFTSPYIYNMTNASSFDIKTTGERKRAIFVVLPDEKATYNTVATLFLQQQYMLLVKSASKYGERLPIKVNFILDEFGNFAKIDYMGGKISASASRGIRFNIVIQSFSQLDEKYGVETAQTIKDNIHCLIYLSSENPKTNKEISERLDKYTTSSYGHSNSNSSRNPNSSSSMNLIGRELLMPSEVKKIKRPYVLVIMQNVDPAIMQLPDLSQWRFNEMLGMGDKDHNTKLRMLRQSQRPTMKEEPIQLWGIWNKYKKKETQIVQEPLEFAESYMQEVQEDDEDYDPLGEEFLDDVIKNLHLSTKNELDENQ